MAKMTSHERTRMMVRVGLMAALVIVGSMVFRTKTPWGTFTLGNVVCALAGILLGPVGGGLAAGLGSMLYDILFFPAYITECWITFLTKGAIGVVVGLIAWSDGRRGFTVGRNVAASAVGAVTYLALYVFKSFAWNGLVIDRLAPQAAMLNALSVAPMSIINAVLAVAVAPIFAIALQTALKSEFHRPVQQ